MSSDELLNLQIEEKKSHIENDRYCCLLKRNTDIRLLRYVVQCSIISMVMMFSMIQLSHGKDKEIYLNMLMLCLGVFIPNPKFND